MTLGELIEKLGGKLIQGSPDLELEGVSSCEQANPDNLVFADSPVAVPEAFNSGAGAVVLQARIADAYPAGKSIVETDQPRLWFARAAKLLAPRLPIEGVHPSAVVGSHVEIGENVTIAAGAIVGRAATIGTGTRIEAGAVIGPHVSIGENCHIYPRVTIYHGATLGNRVVVHAGAVLGADGFGYVRDPATGAYTQFPQRGTLVIEDDVEIGANSTIDNLVHVGHNCDIGEDVILVALTGISGSSTVGKGAVIAGQVGIGDHAHVGPGVILGGQAGVLNGKTVTNEGLKPGTVLWGTPARPLKQVLREQVVLARLAKAGRKSRNREQGTGNRE